MHKDLGARKPIKRSMLSLWLLISNIGWRLLSDASLHNDRVARAPHN